MIVKNNLETDLQIPNGYGEGLSMMLAPKGTTRVTDISPSLKSAQSHGLVTISEDVPVAKPVARPAAAGKTKRGAK